MYDIAHKIYHLYDMKLGKVDYCILYHKPYINVFQIIIKCVPPGHIFLWWWPCYPQADEFLSIHLKKSPYFKKKKIKVQSSVLLKE